MDVVLYIVAIGLLWVLPIFKAHEISRRKGKQGGWLWGFGLGWIGVWVLMGQPTPKNFEIKQIAGTSMAQNIICPDCAETISAEANVCRFCGHTF